MPIYEYKCSSCGQTFEVLQRFSDPPLTDHENCGGHVERLVSAAALRFKGTGWYVTDYARASSGSNGKNGDSKRESGDSKNGSGDSKSESGGSKSEAGGSKSESGGSKTPVKTESKPEKSASSTHK